MNQIIQTFQSRLKWIVAKCTIILANTATF